ncbi:MAG: alpha/beta hydrolase [Cyclobacteriaceae bacterium]
MKYSTLLVTALLAMLVSTSLAQTLTKIKSGDGIEIGADLYQMHPDSADFIVLFHQAGWSRGEYQEIAPKLNARGYNCIAVDQRSGNGVNGVDNLTYKNATGAMKETKYLDAYQDIEAVVAHVKKNYAKGKVIIWGSSYSSSLVLRYAGEHGDMIDAALAFSPGEYFKAFGKPSDYIQSFAAEIGDPVFITSARNEKGNWWPIYEAIPSEQKSFFVPESLGNHGSRALWQKFTDHRDYWKAVDAFLTDLP